MKVFTIIILISFFGLGKTRKRDKILEVAQKARGAAHLAGITAQKTIAQLLKEPAWWTTAIIYQIQLSSFKDSDGDGIGDIHGITQKLPYLKSIGVEAILVSPPVTYPQYGLRYEMTADRLIDPIYGNMKDVRELIATTHELGMYILLDFIPNRLSPLFYWFQKSINKEGKYSDYFIWKAPVDYDEEGDPVPPNSWIDINDRNIWIWNQDREEFYLAQANEYLPVLKLGNPQVAQEMMNNMKFWLDAGVNGFRIDALECICDERHFQKYIDANPEWIVTDRTTISLDRNYDLPEKCNLAETFSRILGDYIKADKKPRIILVHTFGGVDEQVRHYLGEMIDGNPRFMVPMNIQLMEALNKGIQAFQLKELITTWLDNLQEKDVANWIMGNGDTGHLATKVGSELLGPMNMLQLMLPGIALVNMGQELGMQNAYIRKDLSKDSYAIFAGATDYWSQSRDFYRTPMQWDASISAGFSTNRSTWLPVHPNYYSLNVEAAVKAERSNLKLFRDMAILKQSTHTLKFGNTEIFAPDSYILVIKRYMWNQPNFILVINTDLFLRDAYVSGYGPHPEGDTVTVVLASLNSDMKPGQELEAPLYPIRLLPKTAVLLKTNIMWKKSRASKSKMNTQLDIIVQPQS